MEIESRLLEELQEVCVLTVILVIGAIFKANYNILLVIRLAVLSEDLKKI